MGELIKDDGHAEEGVGSVSDAELTVVVTAMELSARARAELGSRLGPGHVVRDIREAGHTADIVLAPAASPQTLSGLREMFPGATVLVGEISDDDFDVHHSGPLGRMLDGGADGYFVMPGLAAAAAITRDVAAGRQPLAIAGSMASRPPAALTGPATRETEAATVHLLCGLNGAGKTTHARRLETDLPAVRFTLDEWMLRLYAVAFDDPEYPALAERCTSLIWDTALQVINSGRDVVLDWNCWSAERRLLWADRARTAGAGVLLHHLTTDLATAQQRSDVRNAEGLPHAHRLTADGIAHLASIFEPPQSNEGIDTVPVR